MANDPRNVDPMAVLGARPVKVTPITPKITPIGAKPAAKASEAAPAVAPAPVAPVSAPAGITFFSNEKKVYDKMLGMGVPQDVAVQKLKDKRKELMGGDTRLTDKETAEMKKMQAEGVSSRDAVAKVLSARSSAEPLWKKVGRGTVDLMAGNLQTIANYGGNVLDFATLWQQGYGKDVQEMMEANKKTYGGNVAFAVGSYLPDVAMAAVPVGWTVQAAKAATAAGRALQFGKAVGTTAAVGWLYGAATPILQKGSEATVGDVAGSAALGAAFGAGAHALTAWAVKAYQWTKGLFATKEAGQLANEAVEAFRGGIRPQSRGKKPLDSAAIQRETESIKAGWDALVRHIDEIGAPTPKTLNETVDALSDAKKAAAAKYSMAGVKVETTAAKKVADAMRSRLSDASKRGLGKDYEKAIAELDAVGGTQTLDQAEDFLANLNKKVSSAYKTGDFTGVEALEAARAAFRQELLNDVNAMSGKGAEYAQLRKDWGAMHQLQAQIDRQARLQAGKAAVGLTDQLANLGSASAIVDVFTTGGAASAMKAAGLQGVKFYAKWMNSPERGLRNFLDKMRKARAAGYGADIITEDVAARVNEWAQAQQAAAAEAAKAEQVAASNKAVTGMAESGPSPVPNVAGWIESPTGATTITAAPAGRQGVMMGEQKLLPSATASSVAESERIAWSNKAVKGMAEAGPGAVPNVKGETFNPNVPDSAITTGPVGSRGVAMGEQKLLPPGRKTSPAYVENSPLANAAIPDDMKSLPELQKLAKELSSPNHPFRDLPYNKNRLAKVQARIEELSKATPEKWIVDMTIDELKAKERSLKASPQIPYNVAELAKVREQIKNMGGKPSAPAPEVSPVGQLAPRRNVNASGKPYRSAYKPGESKAPEVAKAAEKPATAPKVAEAAPVEAKVAETTPFKGKFQEDMTIVRPKGSKNVGKDTLNPGNITADSVPAGETKASYGKKIGAKGTYKSKNGREYFVFPTEEAGFAAMKRDISMKQAGKTQVKALQNANATLKDYLRAHVGSDVTGTSYAKAVLKETGVSMDTPFRSVDTDALARGIAKAEGYWPKKGFSKADVSPVGGKDLTTGGKKGSMGGTQTTEPMKIPEKIHEFNQESDPKLFADLKKWKELVRGEAAKENGEYWVGRFWTDDVDIAKSFHELSSDVSKKTIKFDNPIDVRDARVQKYIEETTWIDIEKATSPWNRDIKEFDKLQKWAEDNGFDWIIGRTSDESMSWTWNEYIPTKNNKYFSQGNKANQKVSPIGGKKVEVYHWTSTKWIKALDPKKAIEQEWTVFFSSNKDVADIYTQPREYGEPVWDAPRWEIISADLELKNPKIIDYEWEVADPIRMSKEIKEAKEKWHDGVIFKNIIDGFWSDDHIVADSYAVFDKDAIKIKSRE